MVQDISPDDLLHRMILLHMAYHKIENCLQRLKHIMIFDTNIPSKLQSYFEEENAIVSELYTRTHIIYIIIIMNMYVQYVYVVYAYKRICIYVCAYSV